MQKQSIIWFFRITMVMIVFTFSIVGAFDIARIHATQIHHAGEIHTPLPQGCTNDGKADYPDAIDCILPQSAHDCNVLPQPSPCNYESANRIANHSIQFTVTHDTETSLQDTLAIFSKFHNLQDPSKTQIGSAHYVIDKDGTVYQLVHDKDIAYHAGNYWYNQHSLGIEHVGVDATGYTSYNYRQYFASARLMAYFIKTYNIPFDRGHILSHGTIPATSLTSAPNHVDPGPYWLWSSYLQMISTDLAQLRSVMQPITTQKHIITPLSDGQIPNQGNESSASSSFFYLYNNPDTGSGKISNSGGDITDVGNNVEANMSYAYLDGEPKPDQQGTGDFMYHIWYGLGSDSLSTAQTAWLAIPKKDTSTQIFGAGQAIVVRVNSNKTSVYSQPGTTDGNGNSAQIGIAPAGAIFASMFTEDHDQWYEINYNHRQAWLPANSGTQIQ